MRAVRTIVAVLFAVTITVTGCTTAPPWADQPSPPPPVPDTTHGAPPTHRADPDPVPVDRTRVDRDRQALIYAAVLRQYLTSGDHSFGNHRFPQVFVLDHTEADAGASSHAASGAGPIPATVRRAITGALADVGPLTLSPPATRSSRSPTPVPASATTASRSPWGQWTGAATGSRWASTALWPVLAPTR